MAAGSGGPSPMLLSQPHIRKAAPVLMGPLSDYCTGTNVNARAMCSVPGAANNKKKAVHKKDVPYLSVDLWFSERVLVGRVKARFRFDTGPVHEREIGAGSGNQFPLLVGLGSDESKTSFHEFKTSKKLRTQVKLPWAGDTVIEFDTSGASEALNTMPCKER
jgi:hypothetical protein